MNKLLITHRLKTRCHPGRSHYKALLWKREILTVWVPKLKVQIMEIQFKIIKQQLKVGVHKNREASKRLKQLKTDWERSQLRDKLQLTPDNQPIWNLLLASSLAHLNCTEKTLWRNTTTRLWFLAHFASKSQKLQVCSLLLIIQQPRLRYRIHCWYKITK